MTRLITMVAVSGLVLGVAAPALWAADAPSIATSPSAVTTQPSAAPAAQNSASMPQSTAPAQNTAAAPQAAPPAPLTTAQATQTTVKSQQPVRRIYRPDDHMANKLNGEVLARINANNAANYGSSR